jgi:hypothetical protein
MSRWFCLVCLCLLLQVVELLPEKYMRVAGFDDLLRSQQSNIDAVPICHPVLRLRGGYTLTSEDVVNNKRIVVIGDVHGDYNGLKENMYQANITVSKDSCEWKNGNNDVLFVQMGDIVDRGPNATEAFLCLRHLQQSAPEGSQVVRLVGNHELWWLEGAYHMRNKRTDTNEKISYLVQLMKEDIQNNLLLGAFSYVSHGVPLLFSHAGLRPDMKDVVVNTISKSRSLAAGDVDEVMVASYINEVLVRAIGSCQNKVCTLKDAIFQAGPERGGSSIGGSYWTDFQVLQNAANSNVNSFNYVQKYIQIVGHSVEIGKIRVTSNAEAVCVDAGMYANGRAYLVIDKYDGRFRAHEKDMESAAPDSWIINDITKEICKI